MKLEGTNILFIGPDFFGYEKKIAEKMEELAAKVDFFDEKSISTAFEKAFLKINPNIFYKKSMNYFHNILKQIEGRTYDYVFVIKCEMLPGKIIQELRQLNPEAVFCLYLYDSLRNIKGIMPKLELFDRIVSFDLEDTKKHPNFIFRPLFYLDDYKHVSEQKDYEYDLLFIGTIHSDRYRIIKKIKEIAKNRKLRTYFYCYLQSNFIYYFYKMVKPEFYDVEKSAFSFDKIASKDVAARVDQAKVIIDIQHPKQTGLTMRTIEMIGMNKKLITTNKSIEHYDFYNPKNIAIIDRNQVELPEGFFQEEYVPLDERIYEKYSIESWIYDVLGMEENHG